MLRMQRQVAGMDDVTCVWWCDMCMMMWHMCMQAMLRMQRQVAGMEAAGEGAADGSGMHHTHKHARAHTHTQEALR